MNEPKSSPASSPVPQGGLDMGQSWPLSPAPFLRQDPVPGRLLLRRLLSPYPDPCPVPCPFRGLSPHPAAAAPSPRAPARRGLRSGLGAVGGWVGGRWCFPSPGLFLLPAQPSARAALMGQQHPSGFWGWGWWGVPQLPPKCGSCSPSTALLSSTLQPTCMEGNVRRQAGGDVMPTGLLVWDGQGGSGHQDGWVMLCLRVVDF